jgi:hypothetical protein
MRFGILFTAVRMMFFWVLVHNVSIFTSALKMETVCFSETLASTDETIRRQNREKRLVTK